MFGSTRKHSRLGQWNGRRRSSRADGLDLPLLWQRDNLLKAGAVLLTALTVAFLVYWQGPTFPYRVGQRTESGVRVRVPFVVINQLRTAEQRAEQEQLLDQAREQGKPLPAIAPSQPAIDAYIPGLLLVKRGEVITPEKFALLQEEHQAYVRTLRTSDYLARGGGILLIILLLSGLISVYVKRFQPTLRASVGKVMSVCVLIATTVALTLLLSRPPWHAGIIPLLVTAMVLTIIFEAPFALLMSFCLAVVAALAENAELEPILVYMGGLATAILLLRDLRRRTRPVEVAMAAGLAFAVTTVAIGMLGRQTNDFIITNAVRNFLCATLAGFIISGSLPIIERWFGIVTAVRLLELADSSHPLMEELVRRAPGTYTHSMTVALLAEAAAEGIGADSLLVRVGSYYHDIGKMLKPQYFIENQSGINRHDELEPALSTLVIIGHVKDGIALAEQYRLPEVIIDFIEQHHGTTLVEYFYREALRLQQANGHGNGDLESSFRYPGPKPQSREAGILMLADAAESASRALGSPTPTSIRKLVHDLMMKRLLDGQFDESGLTLTELNKIEECICRSLSAVFHARIKYPSAEVQAKAS